MPIEAAGACWEITTSSGGQRGERGVGRLAQPSPKTNVGAQSLARANPEPVRTGHFVPASVEVDLVEDDTGDVEQLFDEIRLTGR
jgi:hypothetical protein